MSILKSEVKIGAVHEIGCRLDDNLEEITKDLYRSEGAASVWSQVLSMLETANRNVDTEINEGKIDLEAGTNIRRYLKPLMSTAVISNKQADQNKAAIGGKVQALQMAIQITKKYKDDEMAKLQVIQTAISKGFVQPNENGELVKVEGSRPEGTHPGMSLKQKRLAEEAARAAQDNTQEKAPVETKEKIAVKSKVSKKVKKQ
jgi:hypothetical protein